MPAKFWLSNAKKYSYPERADVCLNRIMYWCLRKLPCFRESRQSLDRGRIRRTEANLLEPELFLSRDVCRGYS